MNDGESNSAKADLLHANERLLDAVSNGDWASYASLSDDDLSAIEPETRGHIVQGLKFHKHFFALPREAPIPSQSVISNPVVRMLGRNHGLVAYTRLVQKGDAVTTVEETRLWERNDVSGQWKNIHFHVRNEPPLWMSHEC